MSGQYIFTMNRVGKVVPPKREILRDISLSFFPGAKIGVLGLNGSGKSSLLRIMAGVDPDYVGEARPQPGIKIGFLAQEPQLDPKKDVRGNVEEAVAATKKLLDDFNEISMKFAEPMSDDEMNKLMEKQGKLQEQIDAAGAWELDRKLEIAADALRLPPWDADVTKLSGGERRRVALCQLLLSQPDMLLLDERPTTSTPSRWHGWSASCTTTRHGGSRDPTIATSSTTSPAGSSSSTAATAFRGRAITRRGWNRRKSASSRKRRPRPRA